MTPRTTRPAGRQPAPEPAGIGTANAVIVVCAAAVLLTVTWVVMSENEAARRITDEVTVTDVIMAVAVVTAVQVLHAVHRRRRRRRAPTDAPHPVPETPSGHTIASTVAASSLTIPEPVRSLVGGRLFGMPKATDDLRRFIDTLDPGTAPADEGLVDVALFWIAGAPPDEPGVAGWAGYARDAARCLYSSNHRVTRRAEVAHTAVRSGLLTSSDPDSDRFDQIRAVKTFVAESHDPDDDPTGHLTVCLSLHAYGHCGLAITEATHLLHTWPHERSYPAAAASIMVVLTAMLSACGQHRHARQLIDTHPGVIGAPSSLARDLFALCAITTSDTITALHQPVCTHPDPTDHQHDRHAWSALLHGEHPETHRCAPPEHSPKSAPEEARRPYPMTISELHERIDHQYDQCASATTPRSYPPTVWAARLWLTCQDCHLALLLGDTTVHPDRPAVPISAITLDRQPAWHHPILAVALWRLMHEHLGHTLHALTDTNPDWQAPADTPTMLIGGPAETAATHAAYADGWPHQSHRAGYRGTTPQPLITEHNVATLLSCAQCGLDLYLGGCTIDPAHPDTPAIINDTDADTAEVITAVMRLVSDHAGHELLLLANEAQWGNYFHDVGWTAVIRTHRHASPADGDITPAQYIAGWPEHPRLPRYRGFDPLETSDITQTPVEPTPARRCCTTPENHHA